MGKGSSVGPLETPPSQVVPTLLLCGCLSFPGAGLGLAPLTPRLQASSQDAPASGHPAESPPLPPLPLQEVARGSPQGLLEVQRADARGQPRAAMGRGWLQGGPPGPKQRPDGAEASALGPALDVIGSSVSCPGVVPKRRQQAHDGATYAKPRGVTKLGLGYRVALPEMESETSGPGAADGHGVEPWVRDPAIP